MDGASTPAVDGDARLSRRGDLLVVVFYALSSVLFTAIFQKSTDPWSGADFAACTQTFAGYPWAHPVFRFRVLVPLVARAVAAIAPLGLRWVYWGITGLSVFGILVAYRSFLENFLRPAFAALLSLAIIYPMIWNYTLLNKMYFPFDMPGLLLFVLGCHFIYRRNWTGYYPILLLAALNRETSAWIFVPIFLLTSYRHMSLGRLALHFAGQAALWLAVKAGLYIALAGDAMPVFEPRIAFNWNTVYHMLVFRGYGPRDWVKLGLSFGGLWWTFPWVLRRSQPAFVKRALPVVALYVAAVFVGGTFDEVRVYGEFIPLLLTPVLFVVAGSLGGTRPAGAFDLLAPGRRWFGRAGGAPDLPS